MDRRIDFPRTVAEAAKELSVTSGTIREWVRQGRLGHVRLVRSIRIPDAEIQRMLLSGFTPAKELKK